MHINQIKINYSSTIRSKVGSIYPIQTMKLILIT
uniref:Uncharacterized protein n=1 Tax=Manihot esculenta TaxID=3983 RepID=A0A2C9VKG3_MANES